jgi:hypothetical protein
VLAGPLDQVGASVLSPEFLGLGVGEGHHALVGFPPPPVTLSVDGPTSNMDVLKSIGPVADPPKRQILLLSLPISEGLPDLLKGVGFGVDVQVIGAVVWHSSLAVCWVAGNVDSG